MRVEDQVRRAKAAALKLASADASVRDAVLEAAACALDEARPSILESNREDVARSRADGLGAALLKRLELSTGKIDSMVAGVREVAALDDPLGRVVRETELDDGLLLRQVTVPIGVIGIIFESRPDALVQIGSLCLKSGNAVVLKGGSEAARTNAVLHGLIRGAVRRTAPELEDAIALVESREEIRSLLALDDLVDLVIPRGSADLVRSIKESTRIPVLGHSDGVCHLYVDAGADLEMAWNLARDSKCQYPAVCNAIETLLVHRAVAGQFLAALGQRLPGVELRGDADALVLLPAGAVPATEEDWRTEYNDLILSVKVVGSLQEAIDHINTYGSRHTDAIVTGDSVAAEKFLQEVDAGSVMWNCSTRFADGFRYGFGAEVGISTSKIHARGPVGLDGLTTTKFRVTGGGQVVADYVDGRRRLKHRRIVG